MLFKIALVLLSLWLVGVVGVYDVANLVHVSLLVGLMLLLLASCGLGTRRLGVH